MQTRTGTRTLACLLILGFLAGTAPSQASLDVAALPIETQAPDLAAQPMRIPLDEFEEIWDDLQQPSSGPAPLPTDFNGIRPGQLILVTIPNEGTFICTLSFIFKDTSANPAVYYAGTAGHCLLPASGVATHGPGANFNPSGVVVQACVSGCVLGGQLSGLLAGMVPVGPVVYARQTDTRSSVFCPAGDIGNDFGLIKINPLWYDSFPYTQPEMAVWNGPNGANPNEGTGNVLVFHGNGIVAGTTEPTKARVGLSLNDGLFCSFQFAGGPVHGGDSGSAISFGAPRVSDLAPLHGEAALGTVTHALVGAGALAYGTTLHQSIMMVANDAGIGIALVNEGTPIP